MGKVLEFLNSDKMNYIYAATFILNLLLALGLYTHINSLDRDLMKEFCKSNGYKFDYPNYCINLINDKIVRLEVEIYENQVYFINNLENEDKRK